MRYLSLDEILALHREIIFAYGGSVGIRDIGALESSINQPRVTFDQKDLYPDIVSKAGALCFFLVRNHPFLDGNKRVAHAAMEIFLILNGHEIIAEVDEQEQIMLRLASGKMSQSDFTVWLKNHITIASRQT
jgi:death-on-curing protein|tara:strand:- start:57 stop:452 length:396 start_codon:yes stop_codon:yes gene_type:complete